MSYERSGKILTAIRRQVNSDFNSPNRQNGQNGQNSNLAVYFGLFRFISVYELCKLGRFITSYVRKRD